jgi:endonuclease/exonuclease/phosphatase (EEP) superfamily protein YafD
MKIIKLILLIVANVIGILTITIFLLSILSRYGGFPERSLIQASGYIPLLWILSISIFVLLLLLFVRHYRSVLGYFFIVVIFFLLIGDFSLNPLTGKTKVPVIDYKAFRVITYNVRYFSSGMDSIINFIKKSEGDVFLLSECVLTYEKLLYLKEHLPDFTVVSDNGNDVALLSRYPVLEQKLIELPTHQASLWGSNDPGRVGEFSAKRYFIHALINVDGITVNALTLRLIAGRAKDKSIIEGLRWGRYLLYAQQDELHTFLNYYLTLKGPVVFGGDLNAPPSSGIIQSIRQYADDAYMSDHFFGLFTFRTSFPTMRLDYLFHSKDVIVKSTHIVDVNLSDHFPIRGDFLVPKNQLQVMNQTKYQNN